MKFCKLAVLLLVLSGALLSCATSENSTPSSSINEHAFSLGTSKNAFYQYDRIHYKDFILTDRFSNQPIGDFSIYLGDKLLVDNESRIFAFGDVELLFFSDGYKKGSLIINVKKSTAFDERILVTQGPDKRVYEKGEKFQEEGLEINYCISYTKQSKEKVNESEKWEPSAIKIDGIDASNYEFHEDGYAMKYAIVEANGPQGNTLFASTSLTQNDASTLTHRTLTDEEEKYEWTKEEGKMKVRFVNEKQTREKAFYSPDEINLNFNINAVSETDASNFKQTPSLGEVPLLVVPVVLHGFEHIATEESHQKLEKGFFGKSEKGSLPPSLSSYYYYSSFKQLKFIGEVTPYFNPVKEGFLGYNDPYSFNINTPESIAKDALKWAKETLKINMDDYDSDDDGYVDGLWLVYMEDISNSLTVNVQNPFWPFTSASTLAPGNKENPVLNTFAWVGLTHLWGSYADQDAVAKNGIDAHVLEHETGHMLGLSDYYSYSPMNNDGTTYSPLGKLDIMDRGLGDQNPYSKMLLGWSKPYLILDDCEIEIPSSQIENSFFLLPYDDKTYRKDNLGRLILNPFDEYLLLDYYTYENLYQDIYHDGVLAYAYPNAKGGRLYHVDGRLLQYFDEGERFELPSDPDFILDYQGMSYRCITNSQAGERAESHYKVSEILDGFDEIRFISKDGTLINGNTNLPSENSLFYPGDTFSFHKYQSQFNATNSFNCGKTFSTQFEIVSL